LETAAACFQSYRRRARILHAYEVLDLSHNTHAAWVTFGIERDEPLSENIWQSFNAGVRPKMDSTSSLA
jgi:hypothetical protein